MFVHAHSFEDLMADGEDVQSTAVGSESDQEPEVLEELGEQGQQTKEDQREIRPGVRAKEEDVTSESWRQHRKHVFVLSEAGKPIYSRYGTEEALSSTMGVMMALVSFVEAEKDIIRSIHGGEDRSGSMCHMYKVNELYQFIMRIQIDQCCCCICDG